MIIFTFNLFEQKSNSYVSTFLICGFKIDFSNIFKSVKKGECGYGPNLVIDGKIANFVKGRDAVVKALKIEEEN
jgi:hypothetical protein